MLLITILQAFKDKYKDNIEEWKIKKQKTIQRSTKSIIIDK